MRQSEFEQLYQRYYRQLFLYAYSLTRSKEDAEDLTANTFVKALTTFRSGNIQAWMYTVLRNEFFDLKRRQSREELGSDYAANPPPGTDEVLQAYIQNEERQWLYDQINQLPERERELMLLTIQLGCPDREIAKILGITVEHVRVLRHRAKERILKNSKEENQ